MIENPPIGGLVAANNPKGLLVVTKTQEIRVMDFLVLGPFMIWFGLQSKNVPELAKAAMILAGVGTIFYNYSNYQAQQ